MGFVSNNSDTVKLARLRCGSLACFVQCSVKDLKYMIKMQSHGFSCSLGIIALAIARANNPNCTLILVITYTNSRAQVDKMKSSCTLDLEHNDL